MCIACATVGIIERAVGRGGSDSKTETLTITLTERETEIATEIATGTMYK